MGKWFKSLLSSLIFSLDYSIVQKIYQNKYTIVLQCHLYPGAAGFEAVDLAQTLPFLKKHFEIRSLADNLAIEKKTKKPKLSIVIDDFGKGFTELTFPHFEKYKIPFTLAIPVGLIPGIRENLEPSLRRVIEINRNTTFECDSFEDLQKVYDSGLVEIASHTLSHPLLSNISEDDWEAELVESKRILEHHFLDTISGFVYPFGYKELVTDKISEAIKLAGYTYAVTTETGVLKSDHNLYAIPRMNGDLGLSTMKAHLTLIKGFISR